MLFVLVMEAFSRLMLKAKEGGCIDGFSVSTSSGDSMSISHLLFADDTVVFCDANIDQMCHLKCILLCFEAISGLRINLAKSETVNIGTVANIESMAGILGCRISSLPMKYLGLPLGAPYKSCSIWNAIIEKMEKLVGWKKLYLSKGSNLTLIKSTLSNLPTYFYLFFLCQPMLLRS